MSGALIAVYPVFFWNVSWNNETRITGRKTHFVLATHASTHPGTAWRCRDCRRTAPARVSRPGLVGCQSTDAPELFLLWASHPRPEPTSSPANRWLKGEFQNSDSMHSNKNRVLLKHVHEFSIGHSHRKRCSRGGISLIVGLAVIHTSAWASITIWRDASRIYCWEWCIAEPESCCPLNL